MGKIKQSIKAVRNVFNSPIENSIESTINGPVKKMFNGFNSNSFAVPPKQNTKEYLTTYSESAYLYACVNTIANSVASSQVVAQKKMKNGKVKVIHDNKILELLKHPNKFQSQYELLDITDKLLSLTGKSFWYISKYNDGTPAEIWPINPLYMTIVPDSDNYIRGYIYNATGQQIPLSIDEVLFFNFSDPYDQYSGVGPAQAAGYSLEIEKYSNKWNRNFFFNNATPQTAIITEEELDDDSFDRLKEEWTETYGGISNAKKTAILSGIKEIKVLTQNARDMDFINLKNVTRDEILATFGVPKVLLGMTENVNRATAETAKLVFNENTVRPRLQRIEDKINNELVPMFGENIEIKLQSTETINPEFKVNTINEAVKNGYMSAEEAKQQIFSILGIEN